MKLVLAFFLLVALPVWAQDKQAPPEARAFTDGRTSFEPVPEQKKEAGAPKLNQPRVEIWLPPDFQKHEGPWPMIVFSHGFGGCAKQSLFLTKHLADNGYIVIAPEHEDANCRKFVSGAGAKLQSLRSAKADWPEKPFRNPERWTDKTEADRKDDVLFAVSSMFDDREFAKFVDKDRMALMGYSLGGYTVLGLAGAWPSWKDERFKAVLALSPFADPFIVNKGLRHIKVPVMYQGGTRDSGITPSLKKSGGGAYGITPAPKYFIEYEGAGHFAWTELQKDYQEIIQRTSLEFFDKHVKGKDITIDETRKPQVRTFWKDEGAP